MFAILRRQLRVRLGLAVQILHDAGLAAAAMVRAMVNRYQAQRALASFDSRMLADIGLTRGDVDSAFSEPLWRDPTRRLAVMALERRISARAARRLDRQKRKEQPVLESSTAD